MSLLGQQGRSNRNAEELDFDLGQDAARAYVLGKGKPVAQSEDSEQAGTETAMLQRGCVGAFLLCITMSHGVMESWELLLISFLHRVDLRQDAPADHRGYGFGKGKFGKQRPDSEQATGREKPGEPGM